MLYQMFDNGGIDVNIQNWYLVGAECLFLFAGSCFDLINREVPVNYLLFFGVVGVAGNAILKYQSIWEMVAGACIGGVFLMVGWLTKEAIGYGDGWGLLILGLMKGCHKLLPVVFGAFLFSGVYGLWRLFGWKASREETLPFYPFLFATNLGVYLL